MKRATAVFILLAVLFSFLMIPTCASAVRGYITNVAEKIRMDDTDQTESRLEGLILDSGINSYYYELRITLKRSIIFANIAN